MRMKYSITGARSRIVKAGCSGLLALAMTVALSACEVQVSSDSDDAGEAMAAPQSMDFGAAIHVATEQVNESEFPVSYLMVETLDGLYAPIGLRKPDGDGPFPIVLFASGNGGGGMTWLKNATENRSWTLERLLGEGYAVAWLRYRAEVELGYNDGGPMVQDIRQGRQLLSRGPLEYEDEIAVIEYVKTLSFVDPDRVGIIGLSHGGEMALKITSEYHGLAAAIANEPASHEFLALRADDTAFINPETNLLNLEDMQMKEVEKVRGRIDLEIAAARIATITTPILVMGRDTDHLQGIFRTTYELLEEAGKEVEWVSYDHPEHGYVYPYRGDDGNYRVDDVQIAAVDGVLEFFGRYLKPDRN